MHLIIKEKKMAEPIQKVSIVVSKGSLEGIYPGLIMANGARMEGIDATLFFTFYGLHAIIEKKMDRIKVATVGNPAMCVPTAMGPGLPTWMGAIPGMSWFATGMMKKEM
jgi:peroxiredoxin family protein